MENNEEVRYYSEWQYDAEYLDISDDISGTNDLEGYSLEDEEQASLIEDEVDRRGDDDGQLSSVYHRRNTAQVERLFGPRPCNTQQCQFDKCKKNCGSNKNCKKTCKRLHFPKKSVGKNPYADIKLKPLKGHDGKKLKKCTTKACKINDCLIWCKTQKCRDWCRSPNF